MKKEVVVSIGMGPGQLEFIKSLKSKGYSIVAFGKGKNSEEAVAMCDYSAEIDTRDYESAVKWIDSLDVNVKGVGSFAGGAAVTTVQRIANYYNVPTAVPDELVVGSDKSRQQKLYEKYALSSIKTWKASEITVSELDSFSSEDEFIIKPAVGRGSEGIKTVRKSQLIDLLGSFENDEDIIQVVRKGREYRCLLIVQRGEIKLLAPILRKSYRDSVFLGVLRYSKIDIDRITAFFDGYVKIAQLNNTIIKTDIIVSDERIDVIEMDIGVGGGNYYKKYVSRVFGCNLMDEYIKLIMDEKLDCFVADKPLMRMDYVFNRNDFPISYDLDECYEVLKSELGECEFQVNVLHPEKKGGYASNADFIFTVMYESDDEEITFTADDIANDRLFRREVVR